MYLRTNIIIKQIAIINSLMLIKMTLKCLSYIRNDYFRRSEYLIDFRTQILINFD